MKCVSHDGKCPVKAGECERDGECYLWRCEHEHAPRPGSGVRDGFKAALAVTILVLVFGIVGRIDADARDAHAKAWHELVRPVTEPQTFPPRCPPENVDGERLQLSVAQRRDRDPNWIFYCHYKPRRTGKRA